MHIYSTKTNTVSKRTEARFHMTHIIKELYQVRPIDFRAYRMFHADRASILQSGLAVSPNRANRAFT